MADILKCCKFLENRFELNRSEQDVFNDCARERLISLYNEENKQFDKLLNKLDTSIDYNSYPDVKKCVNGLIRMLGNDRKVLIRTIGRLM